MIIMAREKERENTVRVRTHLLVIVCDADTLLCDLYLGYEKLEQLLRSTSAQQQVKHHRLCVWINYEETKQRGQSHCDSSRRIKGKNAISDLKHTRTLQGAQLKEGLNWKNAICPEQSLMLRDNSHNARAWPVCDKQLETSSQTLP